MQITSDMNAIIQHSSGRTHYENYAKEQWTFPLTFEKISPLSTQQERQICFYFAKFPILGLIKCL